MAIRGNLLEMQLHSTGNTAFFYYAKFILHPCTQLYNFAIRLIEELKKRKRIRKGSTKEGKNEKNASLLKFSNFEKKSGPTCASETAHVPWLFMWQTVRQVGGDA